MSDTDLANRTGADNVHIRESVFTLLLGLTIVLVIMNTMMFNLALPDVAQDFALSSTSVSWIVTGYSILFAISSITYSRLSDFVPIRRLYVIGILSFGGAAIIGLFSNSFIPLLIARLIQASGAGAIPALSMVLITRYVPVENRGKAMAAIMSAASLGLGLGPVIGGVIVEYLGWHYLFVITSLTLALIPFYIRLLPKETPAKGSFDLFGALFAGIGTTGLLLFLTSQVWYWLAAGLAAIILFVFRIRMARDPFVQPALFRNGRYLMVSAVGIGAYLCSFATLFILPQILVHQFGLSASESGFIIFPGSLLAMILSRLVGRVIDRYGNRHIILYIPLLMLAAVVLFAIFASHSQWAVLFIYMMMSIGFTFISSSVSNELSRLLPGSQVGSGLGLFQLLQFFSGAFGIAATATALEWQEARTLASAYSSIFWGMAIIVLLVLVCSFFYTRRAGAKTQQTAQSVS
ncbi:DHA2 family metal-tetracycline-proton antiporter-like MFS transporter [Paenibacillus phyllosphaerae]|uniref:DHA2 family metal-tetracycline-proton antiporter-like MFS transporter n=1 Tax=Paenibacillus phyllosphaerae TaxID=274593 RepID=A0A7W5FRC4_9BACL|nr:MFS transporter [Paenibacillus phyllosphaerae]MBB3114162.1 DHA2 family metal-tetracycline-proton antiporter-like MFS transporter [Paenibacillus phyllosphaerae]